MLCWSNISAGLEESVLVLKEVEVKFRDCILLLQRLVLSSGTLLPPAGCVTVVLPERPARRRWTKHRIQRSKISRWSQTNDESTCRSQVRGHVHPQGDDVLENLETTMTQTDPFKSNQNHKVLIKDMLVNNAHGQDKIKGSGSLIRSQRFRNHQRLTHYLVFMSC